LATDIQSEDADIDDTADNLLTLVISALCSTANGDLCGSETASQVKIDLYLKTKLS
jgi:hypothetical protein